MTNEQLQELLDSLSLEEKVGQLIQLSGDFFTDDEAMKVGPQQKLGIDPKMIELAGSVLNVSGAEKTRAIQEAHLARDPHKIPLLFMCDVIYGFRTVFPIPLGFAASWDVDLVHACYEVAAEEARAAGVHVTFAPMLDLVRDARWGRCLESTGEDPYLQSCYAKAMVEGFQGGPRASVDFSHKGIASCIKHFAGYGAVEAGREYNTVDMTERRLREMYLPPYKAAVDAGCELVMPSFNTIDQMPATGNKWLLDDVLRGEWGFDGTIITDYAAINELIPHGVAADAAEAAELAINAGVDIDMKTACYANNLCDLVRAGKVSEELVDRACMRVLQLKNKLGLFEDPYRDTSAEAEAAAFLTPEHRALSRKLAAESMLLLKNDAPAGESAPMLPLDAETSGKVALIGPYADTQSLVGLWAVHADTKDCVTLREAFAEVLGDRLAYAQGCPFLEDDSGLGMFGFLQNDGANTPEERAKLREEALAVAVEADVVVMALGEHPMESGEGGSKSDLRLPAIQRELLAAVRALGKKVVVVAFSGRTPVLADVEEHCDALIEAWYPGTEGPRALADVVFGRVNPSARTAMSFPAASGQAPIYYNAFNTGRPEATSLHTNRFTSRYVDCPTEPLHPFGFGLSYHTAEYGELHLSATEFVADGSLAASIDVVNTGTVAGTETVQLYIRDITGSVVRPVKELKGFKRVELAPGETATVEFEITEPMLRFYRRDMSFGSEPGKFAVMVGPNSRDVQTAEFTLL